MDAALRTRGGESIYSPVRTRADGSVNVVLGESHPGFADPVYRARRDAIASLAIFHEAGGLGALRAKSIKLNGYLQFLLEHAGSNRFTIITPKAGARGCQLSILAREHPKELFNRLEAAGVKCDFRQPNVIRVAPTPLYNTFHEVWRFAKILTEHQ